MRAKDAKGAKDLGQKIQRKGRMMQVNNLIG